MKLTKNEKIALLKAAQMLAKGAKGVYGYSCVAIEEALRSNSPYYSRLVNQYSDFYRKESNGGNWFLTDEEPDADARNDWRILLLLWFREVGPDGIAK
jgi:hypothetical protein